MIGVPQIQRKQGLHGKDMQSWRNGSQEYRGRRFLEIKKYKLSDGSPHSIFYAWQRFSLQQPTNKPWRHQVIVERWTTMKVDL